MKDIFFLVVCYTLLSSCNASSPKITYRDGNPDIYTCTADDTKMNDAKVKAKKTFHEFYYALTSNNKSKSRFNVKIAFDIIGNSAVGTEHIWISNLTIKNDSLFGIVSNDPIHTKGIKFGDRIYVDTNKVSDWFYIENGKLIGGYTIRMEYAQMNDSDKYKVEEGLGCKIE